MNMIRNELLRLVRLCEEPNQILDDIALQELEHYGDDLLPGLIACLTDSDSRVRYWAVNLIGEMRPRPRVALPFLFDRLADDDSLVLEAVIYHVTKMGPIAAAAIPHLESWIDGSDEYQKVHASIIILSLDPNRTELVDIIREGLTSNDRSVRYLARSYFGRTKTPLPFDVAAFQEVVRLRWDYHTPCEQVHWTSEQQEDGTWHISASPVIQEIWGGAEDGKRVWSAFVVSLWGISQEAGVEFTNFYAISQRVDHSPTPFVEVTGEYFGEPFSLRVYLEPLPNSETRELVDTVRQEVRAIEITEDNE